MPVFHLADDPITDTSVDDGPKPEQNQQNASTNFSHHFNQSVAPTNKTATSVSS